MTDTNIIIAIAKLDGWLDVKEYTYKYYCFGEQGELKQIQGRHPNKLGTLKGLKDYLTSRDAIIPVIEKQDFTEGQWEIFLHHCIPDEADWIACNKVWYDERFRLQQSRLPRAFRLLVTLNAKQLSIALLKATGNYKESL